MRIKKILNNNVITFEAPNGNEDHIAMGRGLAFGKKVGDEVNENAVDNVFVPDSKMKDITKLIESIPYEYFEISEEILTYAKFILAKPIDSTTLLFLTDHIYGAVQRAKEGIYMKTTLFWDVKRFYKDEFEIATKGYKMVQEELGVKLDESEIALMALNIAASMKNNSTDLHKTTKIMQEIVNIIRLEFMVEIDEESVNYYRFINHLKYFAERVVSGDTYEDKEDDLLDIIKDKYVNSYNVAEKIAKHIKNNYDHELAREEILYLTIHIERIIYRTGD